MGQGIEVFSVSEIEGSLLSRERKATMENVVAGLARVQALRFQNPETQRLRYRSA